MDIAWRRLAQQALIGAPRALPEEVVASLLAVQSQDYLGAKWAVAQRMLQGDDAGVQRAFQEGRILRTHVLRPTWHFVAPADIRWLLALTAPRVIAASAYYYRQHGMDAAAVKRSNGRIVRALAGGQQLTRAELGGALGGAAQGMEGNRLAAFIMRAELDALICSGAMRGKQHTYALLEERAPASSPLGRDEALATLALRYVGGHGPAQVQDLAWWSGLTVADARRGFEACGRQLVHTLLDGCTYWSSPTEPVTRRRGPVVHLLPNYDELLVAFKDRSLMLEPNVASSTSALSGHVVVVDGRIIGGWRRTLSRRDVVVAAKLLRPPSVAERKGLERAAARYAASLGLELRLELFGAGGE
jgi:Winged helix DNA-binding domain